MATQQRQLTTKIAQDSAVSLFDDPLSAIANAFTLPWDEQALAGINTKMTVTADHMGKLHNHVQQSAKTADVISTKVTEASLALVASAAEALQVKTAAKAGLDAARAGADAVQLALTADSKVLELRMKERQIAQADEQMEMARKREERQIAILDKQMKDQADKETGDALAFQYANAALIKEGKNPLTLDNYKMWKGTSAEFLNTLITKGMQLAVNGNEKYSQGATIEERFKWQSTIGWKPETPQQETVMMMQAEAVRQASEMPLADKKQIPAQANNMFVKNFRAGQDAIREGSPFSAPSLSVMAQSRVGQHPLWQKYIAPTITDTNKSAPLDPAFVLEVGKKALLDRAMPSKEIARFISDAYRQAVEINNATHHFHKITGMSQERYGARVDLNGWQPGKDTVEMTDPVKVQAAIQKMVALELVGKVNWAGRYPAGKSFREGGSMYPPITEAGVILGAKE